jgi:hypothetical protein
MSVKIGDRIRILNENGQYGKWVDKFWIVNHIAYSKEDHPGYDSGMGGEALVDCDGLPVSLYEYEIEVI